MSTFIISMFVLGLGTSLHCVSMCGPLVLTYAVKGAEGGPWYHRISPNAAYQGAKIVSYMLVGLLLGAVGSVFDVDALRPYVYYVAGVFMVILGLGMTGRVKWAQALTPRPPKWLLDTIMRLRRRSVADAGTGESRFTTPVFFGLITGLLPCGPLMAAQVSAAASGSPLTGALGMAAFGLGTAPLMVAFGTAGSLIPYVWKQRMMAVLAVGVILFGLTFIDRGLVATGAPVSSVVVKTSLAGSATPAAETAEFKRGADGVAEIDLVIENVRFVPDRITIPADEPVRLIVERREDNSCSDQLAVPNMGVLVDLAPNAVTTVELPPAKSGTYTLTCGMGMMSGSIVAGAGGSSAPWLPWALGVLVVTGAALAFKRAQRFTIESRDSARILGFRPTEFVLIAAGVLLACIVGAALGGLFG